MTATKSAVASTAKPCRDPSSTTQSKVDIPEVKSTAPAQSIGATFRSICGSVTKKSSITIAASANGTHTRKTHRQPR